MRRRPASPVKLGENDPVKVQPLIELNSRIDGILTGHGVHYKQNFVRVHSRLDVGDLGHHLLIHMQAAGRIDDQDITCIFAGSLNGFLGNAHGILNDTSIAFPQCVDRHSNGFGNHFQLIDCCRTVYVSSREHGRTALPFEVVGKFARERGFPGSLKTRNQNHRWRLG